MKRLQIAITALLLLPVMSQGGFAQSALTTAAWQEFKEVAVRYDSLQASIEDMKAKDPALRDSPRLLQEKLQPQMQSIMGILQALGAKAGPALQDLGNISGFGYGDVRLVKTAASAVGNAKLALEAAETLLPMIGNTDSARSIRFDIVMLLVNLGRIDDASKMATAETLKDMPSTQVFQLHANLAAGYVSEENYPHGEEHAMKAYRVLLQDVRKAGGSSRDSGTDGSLTREETSAVQVAPQLFSHLLAAYRRGKNTVAADGLTERIRKETADSTLWKALSQSVSTAAEQINKENEKFTKPAADWQEHVWIGTDPMSLAGLRGKVVLVDFFATWCKPCIMAFPHLRDWKKTYEAEGLVVLGMTNYQGRYGAQQLGPEEEFEKLRSDFITKHDVTWPVGVEKSGRKTFESYGVSSIPHVVLIDRKGTLRYEKVGAADYDRTERMIKKLLQEKD